MNYAIAVLDIGKTNKKAVVYSDTMETLAVRKRPIETIVVDGMDVEDVDTITSWFLIQLKELNEQFPIRAISVSTQGASLVCVGKDGKPSVPPIAYTNEVPEDVHERFWAAVGSKEDIQRQTATAEVKPLINAGKLLWYQKERWPEDFEKTEKILLFPQYFGYRLTGIAAADYTYAGCHSYLWDFQNDDWSSVVDVLGVRNKLPTKPGRPENVLGSITPEIAQASGLHPETKVSYGIHDSNSSLVPYLISQKGKFVLNSTGTWCVAMQPVKKVSFAPDEIGKMVFYNLSFRKEPVKTSILLGGLEYGIYTDLLMKHHKRDDWPVYDPAIYDDILSSPRSFILPTLVPGTGQFPDSVARIVDNGTVYPVSEIQDSKLWPSCFDDYLRGFALANLSLAIQTRIALQRVDLEPGTPIFIEGGFRQNENYTRLLGALLPDNPIFLTALEEATSFGAALIAKAMMDKVSVDSLKDFVVLDKQAVSPASLEGLEDYVAAFQEHV